MLSLPHWPWPPLLGSNQVIAQNVNQEISASSTLEEIKKRGSIRVGFSTFVPWAMRNTKGEFIGFEIEVAKKLAEDNGWTVEQIPTAWDGIIPALIAGKFDVIIGGMSATPKRSQTVNFTIPYAYSTISMAANKELADGWTKFEEFDKPEVTLVVRRGSSNVEWMKKKFPNATYRYFDDDAQAFQEVMNGNAHGVVSAEPKPSLWSVGNSDVLFKPFGDEKFNYYSGWFRHSQGRSGFLDLLEHLDSTLHRERLVSGAAEVLVRNGWLVRRGREQPIRKEVSLDADGTCQDASDWQVLLPLRILLPHRHVLNARPSKGRRE